MASQANITVFDGAATPVSHTLIASENKTLPDGTRLVVWQEMLTSLPDIAQVRVEQRKRVLKSGVVEVRTDTYVPVMESISGQNSTGYTAAPKVAYVDHEVRITFQHPRSTQVTRQICAQLARNVSNNVSTTTPAIAAGVAFEAHIQGIMAS